MPSMEGYIGDFPSLTLKLLVDPRLTILRASSVPYLKTCANEREKPSVASAEKLREVEAIVLRAIVLRG